ncbi:MAG TPA: hypothetical protein EYP48_02400 [Ignisphaera sp.]|uniref:Carbohydrate kinase PfkB domain-containing protein n=1 Tax=Ignisphaera aggregans TaxID=334771 RepID=A0A832YSP3_9CREN|nr:hypothetical protein [Ignisphaera sp.]HIP57045.1 hypothetical protein [Ignisphaera aggregans]
MISLKICVVGYVTRETEIWSGGERRSIVGGAAYFVSYALANLGVKPRLVTRVGSEVLDVLDELKSMGIEVVNLGGNTMMCNLIYKTLSEREIEVISAPQPFKPSDIEYCGYSDIIYLGPQTATDMGMEVILWASRLSNVVILDVQGFTRRLIGKRIEYVDWEWKYRAAPYIHGLKVDHREGKMLTGSLEPLSILRKLSEIGFKEMVLTTDSGVYLCMDGLELYAPYRIERVVGRTGRGDTAVAAYIYSKIAELTPYEAVKFIAAATSIKLSMHGPLQASAEDVWRLAKAL